MRIPFRPITEMIKEALEKQLEAYNKLSEEEKKKYDLETKELFNEPS